jgi:hypothetical protein
MASQLSRVALNLLSKTRCLPGCLQTFLDKVAGNWCCRDKPFIKQGMKEKEKLAIHW